MKILSILLLMCGILLSSVQLAAAVTSQEKVQALDARIKAVEKRSGIIKDRITGIGSKLDQLLELFQEKLGTKDETKVVDHRKQVVIVAGGIGFRGYVSDETGSVAKSTELYNPETGRTCFFKDLPDERDSITMDTINNTATLCGQGSGKGTNCIQYTPNSEDGTWTGYGRTEGGTSEYHSSWLSSAGLLLIGGSTNRYIRGGISHSGQDKNIELVPAGGRMFELETDSRQSCAIQFDDYFVLTGGFYSNTEKQVVQYNLQGFVKNLPDLNAGRYGHGCGTYLSNGNTVMIVAGGGHSVTETMLPGDSAWKIVSPLPQVLRDMAFVSMGEYFLVLGGKNENQNAVQNIYKFDGSVWTEAGMLKAPRYGPAATVVRSDELAELCY